ncbi:MAG TPA: hypothetical protein DIS94_11855 [Bacteroidetes bacterium]|nr:hypothetical protein [Bacteroidota bacterium]
MEPLLEYYLSYSPYSYAFLNPVIFLDIDGKRIIFGQNSAQSKIDYLENVLQDYLSSVGSKETVQFGIK